MKFIILVLTSFYFCILFPTLFFFDLKYRKVPNKFFKLGFGMGFILNIFECLFYFNNIIIFIFGRFFFS